MRSILFPRLAAALLAALLSGLAQAADEPVFCGLGPPPGSPDFAAYQQLLDQQRAKLGYLLVCDRQLSRYDYARLAQPMSQATRRIAFSPVQLDSTAFATFELMGGFSEHGGDRGQTSLHRTFRTPDGRIIDLWEWDMSVDGGNIFPSKDRQTERVNASPAQFAVFQSPSGKAVSILMWVTNRRSYELSIDANVRTSQLRPSLIELAASIPAVSAPPEPDRCRIFGSDPHTFIDTCDPPSLFPKQ